MLSHHAPTRRLIANFLRPAQAGARPSLWVYRRDVAPREIFKVTSESAEQGYFKKDPLGRTESDVESYLNNKFEAPFHALLPRLTGTLAIVLDDAMKETCANYVANMFLRSKPRRVALAKHENTFEFEFARRFEDPILFRSFAAKVSFELRRPVFFEELREALKKNSYSKRVEAEETFMTAALTEFSQLPDRLRRVHWSVCDSPYAELLQSDAAVAMLNRSPFRGGQTIYGFGIDRMGSEWYLPISPRHALRVAPEYSMSNVLSKSIAEQINEFMIRAAYGSVYSSRENYQLREAVNQHLYTLKFFEDLIVTDVNKEVDLAISLLFT